MKINILPDNSKKNRAPEPAPVFKPYYTGSSKTLAFLGNNLLYLISFLFPIIVLFTLMAVNGFAPFGDKNLFILDGSVYNLPHFATFVEQLHSGNFSFFMEGGVLGKEYFSTIVFYLTSPLHLILCFFSQETAIVLLAVVTVLQIGFAGFAMTFYLTHRLQGYQYSKYDYSVLLFSFAFSLSGYFLVQYNDFMYLDCVVLFPLLFLALEHLLYKDTYKYFYGLLAFCFFCNFYMAAIIFVLLFFYVLTRKKGDFSHSVAKCVSYISTGIFSSLTSAITVIPGFYFYYLTQIKSSNAPDFSFITDWLSLYGSFMPLNYASYTTVPAYGSNLYCGLLALILLTMYFFSKHSFVDCIRDGIYFLFLCLAINTSSLQYVFRFFSMPNSSFNNFSFILIFTILIYSSNTLYELPCISKLKYYIAILLPLFLMILSSFLSNHYTNSTSISCALIFLIIYLLLFFFYKSSSINRPTFFLILLLTCCTECILNASQTYKNLSLLASPISDATSESSTPTITSFSPFTIDFKDAPILPSIYTLEKEYIDEDKDYPTEFEKQNAIASTLGCTDELFQDASFTIIDQSNDGINVQLTPDNIISVIVNENSPLAYNPITTVNLSILPNKTGDLYIYTNDQLTHIGNVTSGQAVKYEFTYPTAINAWQHFWIYGAYLSENALKELKSNINPINANIELTGLSSITTNIKLTNPHTVYFNIPYSNFISVNVNGKKGIVSKGPNNTIGLSLQGESNFVQFHLYYWPSIISLLISLLSLFFLISKKFDHHERRIAFQLTNHKVVIILGKWIKKNAIPLLAFFIPFFTLIACCVIKNCTPFGANSFLLGDGIAGYIPTIYQMQQQNSDNSFLYSWFSGGGSNYLYAAPYSILYYWTRFLSHDTIIPLFTIIEIICISLCGVTLYIYLTKRSVGQKMYCSDYRILIFTNAYALSAYTINFRNNLYWMYLLALLPLLLLALDKLVLYNKKTPYILLLGFCITASFNIAFFICIFLTFTFLTYDFKDIKDFLKKAINFLYSSLLSAGIVFWSLAATYLGFKSTAYGYDDAIFPSFTFFQNYWDSFKQFFIFANPISITENNGAINLYCGIFCLLLFFLSLQIKHHKQYYLKILFMVFILFSSNNNLLSYLWNGLHYQSKVPNRYSFILIFLLIDIGVDTLYLLHTISKKKVLLSLLLIWIFYGCILIFSKDQIFNLSFISTGIILSIFSIFIVLGKYRFHRSFFRRALFLITLIEILFNTLFTIYSEDHTSGLFSERYNESIDYYKNNICTDSKQDRINFIGLTLNNQNSVCGVNSFKYFNSQLSPYQFTIGAAHGLLHSSNVLDISNNASPFNNAVLSNKYMLLDKYSTNNGFDITHYQPIASINGQTILYNPRCLTLGFYIQADVITSIIQEKVLFTEDYANKLAAGYTSKSIFTDLYEVKAENNNKNMLCSTKVYHDSADELFQRLYIVPQKTGEYYFRNTEFYYLGTLEAGKHYQFDFPCIEKNGQGWLTIFHEDAFEEFYEGASQYTMDVSEFEDTSVRGTITLPEEGYIYLSIPYERGWSATVDGKDAIVETAPDGLTMIKASAGTHEVHLTFRPYGLTVCIVGTLIAWIIFLFTILFERRHNKRMLLKAAEADTTLPPAHLRSHQQAAEPHCELPQACSSAPQAPQEGSLPGTACYTDTLSDRSGGQAPDSIADTSAASEMKTQG